MKLEDLITSLQFLSNLTDKGFDSRIPLFEENEDDVDILSFPSHPTSSPATTNLNDLISFQLSSQIRNPSSMEDCRISIATIVMSRKYYYYNY